MVFVTFRRSDEKLTSMFSGGAFATVEEAKEFIEDDATYFLKCHAKAPKSKGGQTKKFRQSRGWRSPDYEDYYEVKAKDGTTCVWQYFNRV